MRRTGKVLFTAGVAAAGAVATSRIMAARRSRAGDGERWHVITVNREYDEVGESVRPGPLAALGDGVEIAVHPAPGGRGVEISARARAGAVPDGDIRRALRESRSELEVGYVLLPGVATTEPTLLNKPLRTATAHGREGGLL